MAAKKNETVTQVSENVQGAEETVAKKYLVQVTNNPAYCGIGAGGVQFANGQAVIESVRMVAWFREHKGYTVTEQ